MRVVGASSTVSLRMLRWRDAVSGASAIERGLRAIEAGFDDVDAFDLAACAQASPRQAAKQQCKRPQMQRWLRLAPWNELGCTPLGARRNQCAPTDFHTFFLVK